MGLVISGYKLILYIVFEFSRSKLDKHNFLIVLGNMPLQTVLKVSVLDAVAVYTQPTHSHFFIFP